MSYQLNLKEKLISNYNSKLDYSGISGERLATRLNEIAKIGLTTEGGSRRLGFSQEEEQAKKTIEKWMQEAGLKTEIDGIGNLYGRLIGRDSHKPSIMSGSHIDTVADGGHFDGVLGILAALEVVEAWKIEEYRPFRTFEIVAFTSEEGSRINYGYLGSRAMVGELDIDSLRDLKDFNNINFESILDKNGLSTKGVLQSARDMTEIEAFYEVHIEQGKKLEKENLPIGIVNGIAVACRMSFKFRGEAGHVGSTPMNDRKDALVAASDFITKVNKLPKKISESAVATVGRLKVFPNGVGVIPDLTELTIDIRDTEADKHDNLVSLVIETAKKTTNEHKVSLEYRETDQVRGLLFNKNIMKKMERTVESLNLTPFFLTSAAGHDSLFIGEKIPTGMIFVRSVDGHSHNSKEWSTLDDCVKGVHVLKKLVELTM